MNTNRKAPEHNQYALPSGQIVNLPEHCRDNAERFTLADGSIVWAVRVGTGTPEEAVRLAASLPAIRSKPACTYTTRCRYHETGGEPFSDCGPHDAPAQLRGRVCRSAYPEGTPPAGWPFPAEQIGD